MKNRLASETVPSVRYHHAPHNPACVGLLERYATKKEVSTVRVMSSLMRNSEIGGFDVTTVVQYREGEAWVVYSRRWASDMRRANKIAGSETRQAYKLAVSRLFAASLHPMVYVPDTDDIDC